MKITKAYKGITRQKNGDYVITGDLISDEDIEIELDDWLRVTGSIISKKTIRIKKTIVAGNRIEAGDGIKAGLSIDCKWIKARLRIFAGLCTWKNPSEEEMTITCEELKEGIIAFGRLNLIPKKEIKKMTVSEICKELGYDVEIVKENDDE